MSTTNLIFNKAIGYILHTFLLKNQAED